jgi:15-cis-phytoene synthase
MKAIYDQLSHHFSRRLTRTYSTSFSLGIFFLDQQLRQPIYDIYAFVRLADEIVDSFVGHDQAALMADFRHDTFKAIDNGISANPVLHSFQETVRNYGIEADQIDTFLHSMEMDLEQQTHDQPSFETYILGSAEVVGLMCLRVFCAGDTALYSHLKASAMRLGASFQKINFLRDLSFDYNNLHRTYFPDLDPHSFSPEQKEAIQDEIRADFAAGLEGIRGLPHSARFGVYVAYVYYNALLNKIERHPPQALIERRLRLPAIQKFTLLVRSFLSFKLGQL